MCPVTSAAPVVPSGVFNELVSWIAIHTMYDVSELYRTPPEISFCTEGDWITVEGLELRVEPELDAAYSLPDRVIHLVAPWSPDDPYDRSILLHEFVHVVQLSNRDWPCTGAPELEAYMLQASYLKEHGIKADFDWPSIFLLSVCPQN